METFCESIKLNSCKGFEIRLQPELAANTCEQVLLEVVRPVPCVRPSAFAFHRAFNIERGDHAPGIAKGDHGMCEAHLHLADVLDCALR